MTKQAKKQKKSSSAPHVTYGKSNKNQNKTDSPITILGKSKMSLRIEKQNVAGNGAPDGLSKTQCEYTALVVFSNACDAKLSQYSTTDWFSNNCRDMGLGSGSGGEGVDNRHRAGQAKRHGNSNVGSCARHEQNEVE